MSRPRSVAETRVHVLERSPASPRASGAGTCVALRIGVLLALSMLVAATLGDPCSDERASSRVLERLHDEGPEAALEAYRAAELERSVLLYWIADDFLERGAWERGEEVGRMLLDAAARRARVRRNDEQQAWLVVAEARVCAGDYDGVLDALDEVLALRGGGRLARPLDAATLPRELRGDAAMLLAFACEDAGREELARALVGMGSGWLAVAAGDRLARLGDHDAARALWEAAPRATLPCGWSGPPPLGRADLRLARAALGEGRDRDAARALEGGVVGDDAVVLAAELRHRTGDTSVGCAREDRALFEATLEVLELAYAGATRALLDALESTLGDDAPAWRRAGSAWSQRTFELVLERPDAARAVARERLGRGDDRFALAVLTALGEPGLEALVLRRARDGDAAALGCAWALGPEGRALVRSSAAGVEERSRAARRVLGTAHARRTRPPRAAAFVDGALIRP